MSSIDYAETLMRRSTEFLEACKESIENERLDAAMVLCEISAQLSIKAVIVKRGFEPPRVHSVRELLGFIVDKRLFREEILEEISRFTKDNRRDLIILERAREAGQYSSRRPDKEESLAVFEATVKVKRLASRLWELG